MPTVLLWDFHFSSTRLCIARHTRAFQCVLSSSVSPVLPTGAASSAAAAGATRLIVRVRLERLNKYLPTRRGELTAQIVRAVRSQSGFSAEEVFRKYLRYVLDQRPFDADAVADIMALRDAAGLTPETTARALEDLSRRMYQSHGALMLKTDGMGASGTQRKVTGRNYFRKLLYLVELEELIPRAGGGSGADGEASLFGREQLRDMFGATDVDVDEVRMSAEEVAAAARGE